MSKYGFEEVRESLARLMEAMQTASSNEQRAKLEESARELSKRFQEMKDRLHSLPGAELDTAAQKAELLRLQAMEQNADIILDQIESLYKSGYANGGQ